MSGLDFRALGNPQFRSPDYHASLMGRLGRDDQDWGIPGTASSARLQLLQACIAMAVNWNYGTRTPVTKLTFF